MPACGVPSKKIEKGNVLHRSKPQDITGQNRAVKRLAASPKSGSVVFLPTLAWVSRHNNFNMSRFATFARDCASKSAHGEAFFYIMSLTLF